MTKFHSQEEKIEQIKDLISNLETNRQKKPRQAFDIEINHDEKEDYQAMRTRALRYIGSDRGRSYQQVKNILLKYFPEIAERNTQLIDKVVKSLINDDYLDETLCGRRLIKRHSGRKQKSAVYLEHLMKRQGLSEAIIYELLEEVSPDEETAEAYFRLKLDEWDFDRPEKIIRHFASRGYSSGISLKIMRKYANGKE